MRERAPRRDRPSAKPLVVVAVLLLAASTGAAVTTSSAPARTGHAKRSEQVVVTAVTRDHPGRPAARGAVGPDWQ